MFDRALFENHLAFLATHRGRVVRSEGRTTIESHVPHFSYTILERPQEVDPEIVDLRLLPGIQPPPGFGGDSSIVYMVRPVDGAEWDVPCDLTMRRVTDECGIDAFSTVQSRGFIEDPTERPQWHQWLREANQNNRHRPEHHFLVASNGTEDVGVTLMLEHEGLAGIYAVATLPEHRGRGIATALLSEAATRARARGISTLTLQVAKGSAAERLYAKLGFEPIFETRVCSRSPIAESA
jgi:GNAT superfamily N-acetyltransferase